MTYELSPLPKPIGAYSDVLSEQVVNWHHDKHHAGYVTKLNEISLKLKTADKALSNANFSEWGELKRRQSFNHAGIVLHENYWLVLGNENKDADIINLPIYLELCEQWGSFEAWKEDFIATGKSALGWVVLVWDEFSGEFINISVDMHNNGAYWDSKVIIACDVFEHAYYKDYGPDRVTYLNKFVENIDWLVVNELFFDNCEEMCDNCEDCKCEGKDAKCASEGSCCETGKCEDKDTKCTCDCSSCESDKCNDCSCCECKAK